MVREFTLDNTDSALSRLVRNVETAQRTITSNKIEAESPDGRRFQ